MADDGVLTAIQRYLRALHAHGVDARLAILFGSWARGAATSGEVWFWREGRMEAQVLHQDRYARADRSRLFPDLDLNMLCSLLDRPTALQAVKAFREQLRPS